MKSSFFKKGNFSSARGFSFIEALFAIVILSFAAIGLMNLLSNISYIHYREEASTLAVHLAEEKLEKIISDKISQGYAAISNSLYPSETITLNNLNFTRTTNIDEVSTTDLLTTSAGSGLKRVEVTVTAPVTLSQTVRVTSLMGYYL